MGLGRAVAERAGSDRSDRGVGLVAAVVLVAAACRPLLEDVLDRPAVANWATVFVAIAVQAMPFLVLGVAISAAVAAFVPPGFLPRALPRRPALAVPAARDQWVVVTGTFRSSDGDGDSDSDRDTALLAATSVVEIPEPADPYE
jgi:hypothetical protein